MNIERESTDTELIDLIMSIIRGVGLARAEEWADNETEGNSVRRRRLIKRALRKLAQ